jgi:tetratricopeptide (TPR) repeat protein
MNQPFWLSPDLGANALDRLSREQSIALLQQQKPDAAPADLATVAGALDDLSAALPLAGRCWQRYRSPTATQSFIAELQQPDPEWLRLEPDHPEQTEYVQLTVGLNNLGRLLQDQADLPGAHQAFTLALLLDETQFGAQHPYVARDLNKLGTVLHDLGDSDSAHEAFERALAIDEAAFGSEHPCVARDVNNLGIVLQDAGDPASAHEAFKWALSICQRTLGEGHAYTQIVRNHLAGPGY